MSTQKTILLIYHSQGGTMEKMARRFALGADREKNISVVCKKVHDANLSDLLKCSAIAIGTPEYFGTMAGLIKDFFDRTYEEAKEKTVGLPYVLFVSADNDGRGAIAQIERLATGYRWKKVQDHLRIISPPSEADLLRVEELGETLAAGLDFGIF